MAFRAAGKCHADRPVPAQPDRPYDHFRHPSDFTKKQLVERQEHPTDTRAKIIMLTEKGRQATAKAVKLIEKFDAAFFNELDDKTRELNAGLLILLHANQQD